MPLSDPSAPPVAYFYRRTNGTGGGLGSPVYLGHDEASECISGTSYAPAEIRIVPEGQLLTAVVETYYFGSAGLGDNDHTVRKRVRDYIEAARVAMVFKEPLVKQLARSASVMPIIFQSFGDLLLANDDSVVLANCTLRSAEIVDDAAIEAIALKFVFVRVSVTSDPA